MSKADMFLSVVGTTQGAVKGESVDAVHVDQIEVLHWAWGMRGADLSGTASGKWSFQELQVRKRVDFSTIGLYNALRNNEPLKKVVLSVRKSGGEPLDYFIITLEKARITSIVSQASSGEHPEELVEQVNFACRKVGVEYKKQRPDGQLAGGGSFDAEINT
jgi:type VI secretion system secreted protein Hcp